MRKIGLIGGTSWQSTALYYRLLNERVAAKLGGLHSARLVLASVDFDEIETLLRDGNWDEIGDQLAGEAVGLVNAGAEAILICSNTMHNVATTIRSAAKVPLIDIRDATGAAINARSCKRPLFLGTRYAMESDFFINHLHFHSHVRALIPAPEDRLIVNSVIFNELCKGIISPVSKRNYIAIVDLARKQGADAVIFGCTEIGMLLSQSNFDIPIFDTTEIHVDAAMEFMNAPSCQGVN